IMSNEEEARDAIENLQNKMLNGKCLNIQISYANSKPSSENKNSENLEFKQTTNDNYYDYNSKNGPSIKKHKPYNHKNDYFPSQEAITYVKEEILNDPVARLMLLYDLLAVYNLSKNQNSIPTPFQHMNSGFNFPSQAMQHQTNSFLNQINLEGQNGLANFVSDLSTNNFLKSQNQYQNNSSSHMFMMNPIVQDNIENLNSRTSFESNIDPDFKA
ncbi:MAG: hypothetical protein MHPSP_004031, partial [Paramarteilia canceri]